MPTTILHGDMGMLQLKIFENNGKISDYLMCEKIWDKFDMKNIGDHRYHYLKNDVLL